jgi:hypothetical protein
MTNLWIFTGFFWPTLKDKTTSLEASLKNTPYHHGDQYRPLFSE